MGTVHVIETLGQNSAPTPRITNITNSLFRFLPLSPSIFPQPLLPFSAPRLYLQPYSPCQRTTNWWRHRCSSCTTMPRATGRSFRRCRRRCVATTFWTWMATTCRYSQPPSCNHRRRRRLRWWRCRCEDRIERAVNGYVHVVVGVWVCLCVFTYATSIIQFQTSHTLRHSRHGPIYTADNCW